LGPLLLGTLRDFDDEFTVEIEEAWTHAWQFLLGAMCRGYQLSGETVLTHTLHPPDRRDAAASPRTEQSPFAPPPSSAGAEAPPPPARTPSDSISLPAVHYVDRADTSIAWALTGSAPGRSVLFLPAFLTHLELVWREPAYARFLDRLGQLGQLLRFDRRGTGLSERGAQQASARDHADDAVAVLDAAGIGKVSVLAASESAFIAIELAARYPERVQALVLVDAVAKARRSDDFAHGVGAELEAWVAAELEAHWNRPSWLARLAPTRAGDPNYTAWLAEFLRNTMTPRQARLALQSMLSEDVREACARITVPTLVLHKQDDPWVSEAAAADLAARISDAELVTIPGRDHLLYCDGTDAVLEEARLFFEAHG
ncbi:MAG TPA: alpha/beta hydrolase, partial [Polyangiaceae bacterium]|nr:alpha/beta hydrolase [Polyangiaceae bacterium]